MITADHVRVTFRHGLRRKMIMALDELSLTVNDGDFFALIGRNGAGKSTALYCFLGLIQPEKGSIRVMGQHPRPGAALFSRIGYLPEEPHYHLYLSVREALEYYAALYQLEIPDRKVNESLERMGLAEFAGLPLAKCSKGMKQKLGLAQCLISNPRLLFLDEPTRGLDPIVVKDIRDVLQEMHKNGVTIVFNSHVLSEVEMLANRVAVIDKGKVLFQDDLAHLTTPHEDVYEVEFESTTNLPDYVTITRSQGKIRAGLILAASFYPFMEFCRENKIQVMKCGLKHKTLEESLYSILKGDHADA